MTEKNSLQNLIQQNLQALIPLLLIRYISTGDRSLDNSLVIFLTSLVTIFCSTFIFNKISIIHKFYYNFGKTKGGFLYDKHPTYNENDDTSIRNKVCAKVVIYYENNGLDDIDEFNFDSNMYKNHEIEKIDKIEIINGIVVWLNKNIRIEEYRPQINYTFNIHENVSAITFPQKNAYCPFYYVNNDTVYYKYNENSDSYSLYFSATSHKALEYFIDKLIENNLIEKKFCNFSVNEIANINKNKTIQFINDTPSNGIYKFIKKNNKHYDESTKHWEPVFESNIVKKRTFDSLFFEGKHIFISLVNKFKNKNLYPKHIASDNKLGILLYGPPGTGKSSIVVALANQLERDILTVDMSKIKTCSDFDQLMKTPKKYILFLEELDCILGVLKKRNNNDNNILNKDVGKDDDSKKLMDLYISTHDKEQKLEILDRIDKQKLAMLNTLNLGYVLQKIDGIYDENDRIIVACTNYPHLIDDALLRPGRLGIKIELGLCTKDMIIGLICYYLKITDENKKKYLKGIKFPEKYFSPVQLIQIIQMNNVNINNDYDFYKLINTIMSYRL